MPTGEGAGGQHARDFGEASARLRRAQSRRSVEALSRAARALPARADDFCQMVRMERMVPFTVLLFHEMLES